MSAQKKPFSTQPKVVSLGAQCSGKRTFGAANRPIFGHLGSCPKLPKVEFACAGKNINFLILRPDLLNPEQVARQHLDGRHRVPVSLLARSVQFDPVDSPVQCPTNTSCYIGSR